MMSGHMISEIYPQGVAASSNTVEPTDRIQRIRCPPLTLNPYNYRSTILTREVEVGVYSTPHTAQSN